MLKFLKHDGSFLHYSASRMSHIVSGIDIPPLALSGQLGAECDFDLPPLLILGTCDISGFFSIPRLLVVGKTQDFIEGNFSTHLIGVGATLGVSASMDAEINVPAFLFSGAMQAESAVSLHRVKVDGLLAQENIVAGNFLLPVLNLFGTVAAENKLNGNILCRLIRVQGSTLSAEGVIDAAVSFGMLRISGFAAPPHSYVFGEEEDYVLKYSASRRLL
jgi:hypothetical protein